MLPGGRLGRGGELEFGFTLIGGDGQRFDRNAGGRVGKRGLDRDLVGKAIQARKLNGNAARASLSPDLYAQDAPDIFKCAPWSTRISVNQAA